MEAFVDFIITINATKSGFFSWFRNAFGHISDIHKEISYIEESGCQSILKTHNPVISNVDSDPSIIRYESINYVFDQETNKYNSHEIYFWALKIDVIALDGERCQLGTTSTTEQLSPLIKDILAAIKLTWPNFEEYSTQDPGGIMDPLNAWRNIPDHGYDRKIVEMFCKGHTNSEIGDLLKMQPKSVTNRIYELRQKYGVPTREELRRASVFKKT